MREFLSNLMKGVTELVTSVWSQMRWLQRVMAMVVVVVLIVGIVFVSSLSLRSDTTFLFTNGTTDIDLRTRIANRLDTEGISYEIDGNNRFVVENKTTAQYARTLLIREDLVPQNTDPWELFDTERWTQTDFERNVNLQRAITKQLENHIEALDDVDSAKVSLVFPKDELFTEDRNPVSASVILVLKPGSKFRENRNKITGVEKLILFAVEGLTSENLSINDSEGLRLNDFENFADFDSLEQTKRELKIKSDYEKQYKDSIVKALGDIYTPDRVRIVNINIEIDFSKKVSEVTENFPIVVTPDNPDTPYDETEVVLSIPRSKENISESYKGTGFNPEGPPGVEGQVPPSYKDLDGIVGSWDHNTDKVNNEINQRKVSEELRPSVSRVTASVAIDGMWNKNYNVAGNLEILPNGSISRTYTPLTPIELRQSLSLVRSAVGFSQGRGDSVSVENVKFDRQEKFLAEDAAYKRKLWTQRMIIYGIIILVSFIVFVVLARFVSQQITLRRMRKEERLAEQYRKMRESQILAMNEEEEEEDEETDLDRLTRTLTKTVTENPENVSLLIQSWMRG